MQHRYIVTIEILPRVLEPRVSTPVSFLLDITWSPTKAGLLAADTCERLVKRMGKAEARWMMLGAVKAKRASLALLQRRFLYTDAVVSLKSSRESFLTLLSKSDERVREEFDEVVGPCTKKERVKYLAEWLLKSQSVDVFRSRSIVDLFARPLEVFRSFEESERFVMVAPPQGRTSSKAKTKMSTTLPPPPDREPEVYRIRGYSNAPKADRPTWKNFTPSLFLRWARSEARRCMAGERRPGCFPYISNSLRPLLSNSWCGRPRDLGPLLSRAKVLVYHPATWAQARAPLSPPSLCGCLIATLADLEVHRECLRREKPLFRRLEACLADPTNQAEMIDIRGYIADRGLSRKHRHTSCLRLQGPAQSLPLPDGDPPQVQLEGAFGGIPATGRAFSLGGPFTFKVVHKVEGVSELLSELQSLAVGVAPTLAQEALRFVTFLAALLVMETPAQYAASVAQYAVGFPSLYVVLKSRLAALADLATVVAGFRLQSDDKEEVPEKSYSERCLEFFHLVKETIACCFVWPVLETMFGTFTSVILADLETVTGFFKKALVMEAARDFARSFLDGARELVRRLKVCYNEKSLWPLLGPRWDPGTWVRDVQGMIRYYPQLTCRQGTESSSSDTVAKLAAAGEVPSVFQTRVSLTRFKEILERYERDGEAMLAAAPRLGPVQQGLAMLRTLKTTIASVEFGADYRPEPFGIYLFGPAGTGKSTLSGFLMEAIANACDYDSSPTARYSWKPAANFQDGVSHLTWCVHMDDCDQSVARPSAGTPTHFDSWLEVVNTVPWLPEQAAVDMKGRISAQPLLAIFSSNFSDANLRGICLQPAAFWRRCKIYAKVRASPAYMTGADTKIAPDRTTGRFEAAAWEIDLYEETLPTGDPFVPPFCFLRTVSAPVFAKFVVERYKAHISRQLGRLQEVGSKDFCPTCFLPEKLGCGCVVVPQMHGLCPSRAPRAQPPQLPRWPYVPGSATDVDTARVLSEFNSPRSPLKFMLVAAPDELTAMRICYAGVDEDTYYQRDTRGQTWFLGPKFLYGRYFLYPDVNAIACRTCDNLHRYQYGVNELLFSGMVLDASRATRYKIAANQFLFGFSRTQEMLMKLGCYVISKDTSKEEIKTSWDVAIASVLSFSGAAGIAALGVLIVGCVGVVKLQERRDNGVAGVAPPSWKIADQTYAPGIPLPTRGSCYTKEQLVEACREGVLSLSSPRGDVRCCVLGPGLVATTTHALHVGETATITLPTLRTCQVTRSAFNSRVAASHPELLLLVVPEVSGKYSLFPYVQQVVDQQQRVFDEIEIHTVGGEVLAHGVQGQYVDVQNHRVVRVPVATPDGACGSVYLGRTGPTWRLVAMHFALNESMFGGGDALGIPLTRQELERIGAQICVKPQALALCVSHVAEDQQVTTSHFSHKSEAWSAFGQGAHLTPYGRIVPERPGFSPRSKVQRTPFANHFSQLEMKHCGVVPYWGKPSHARGMVDGKYTSPFVASLNAFDTTREIDHKVFFLCLFDYVKGMDRLDASGLRGLSESEAVTGVPGTWIGPMDPRTSTGPPWNVKKFNHFARVEQEAAYSPSIAASLEEFDKALADRAVPVPVARAVLKDEPRPPGKLARVFSVINAGWNMRYKQVMAPFSVFERANADFFESMIGIDMTSEECARIPRLLAQCCAALDAIEEGDYRKLDSCYHFYTHLFRTLVLHAEAQCLGVDPVPVELCSVAIQSCVLDVKGDLVEGRRQPSGNFSTGENNSKTNSFAQRYAYYKKRAHLFTDEEVVAWMEQYFAQPFIDDPRLDFRTNVSPVTFGDDYLKTSFLPSDEFDWESVEAELGLTVTDATKAGPPSTRVFSEAQFLKRKFRFDEDLGRWVTLLDPKSIVRMCVAKLPGTLSDADHHSELLSQALREAAFHGREFYDEFRTAALASARSHDFVANARFQALDFDSMRERMRDSSFRVYNAEELALPRIESEFSHSGLRHQSRGSSGQELTHNMENNTIPNAGAGQHAQIAQEEANIIISHPVGSLDSVAPVVEGGSSVSAPSYQQYHATPLGNFLERLTFLQSVTVLPADTVGVPILSFNPWTAFLTDPTIVAKTKNFSYLRGPLEVEVSTG